MLNIHQNLQPLPKQPRAIIVPHAGYTWSGETAAAAYSLLQPYDIQRVFILAPNHRMPVNNIVADDADTFETPLGKIRVHTDTITNWHNQNIITYNRNAHRDEHAIEIQLPLLQVVIKRDFTIVPLIVGQISNNTANEFATTLQNTLSDNDLLVISTDLVHYGETFDFIPFKQPTASKLSDYDNNTIHAISTLDPNTFDNFAKQNPHAACGLEPLRILTRCFQQPNYKAKQIAYDTSGNRSGDYNSSVSYLSMAIIPA
jgi:hypothetical protein